jgi:hypothetical protein
MSDATSKPHFGIGTVVNHPAFGRGKITAYDGGDYVILFKGPDIKRVGFSFELLKAEGPAGDAEMDRIREAVRDVLGEHGWADVELELGKRWVGGTLKMIPGKEDTQPKDVPIEMFFKKIIGLRDKLRVLEQKINAHPQLSGEDKLEMQGYITRCYGSMTTFNSLFAVKESQFQGTGKEE